MHLLVDGTGLKLCGKGEWLLEKNGTATRPAWRMLHPGLDAGTGRILASTLTSKDADDASQADPLLDQATGSVASFTADDAYDQDRVYVGVAERHPERHGRERTGAAGRAPSTHYQARAHVLADRV